MVMKSSLLWTIKLSAQLIHLKYQGMNITIFSVIKILKLKTKRKLKFYAKYFVWQVIVQNGQVSKFYIMSGTINKHVNLEKWAKKHLAPL